MQKVVLPPVGIIGQFVDQESVLLFKKLLNFLGSSKLYFDNFCPALSRPRRARKEQAGSLQSSNGPASSFSPSFPLVDFRENYLLSP